MIIPINLSLPTGPSTSARPKLPPHLARLGDANSDELVLIELQGELEVEGKKDGHVIGKLKFDAKDKPTLMIGHNLLEGKITTLPKPLAVLQRGTAAPEANGEIDMDIDTETPRRLAPLDTSWDMVSIVKRKIVFSKRPMPIVGTKLEATAKD